MSIAVVGHRARRFRKRKRKRKRDIKRESSRARTRERALGHGGLQVLVGGCKFERPQRPAGGSEIWNFKSKLRSGNFENHSVGIHRRSQSSSLETTLIQVESFFFRPKFLPAEKS